MAIALIVLLNILSNQINFIPKNYDQNCYRYLDRAQLISNQVANINTYFEVNR